jgi:hypothetical protein
MARARRERDELEEQTGQLEEELEELKARYEQYFLGVERREPVRQRDELRKRILRIKEAFTRNTGLRFRIQSLHARYLSYERLWLRSAREREEGTYRRDLEKARRHVQRDAAAAKPAPAEPAPAATPGAEPASPAPGPAPRAAAPPPLPAGKPAAATPAPAAARPGAPAPAGRPATPAPLPPPPAGGPSEVQLRALYTAYVAAKKSCNEDTSRLTYDAVARTIAKQVPELMTRFKAKTVEFKVDVRDGKAILKAIPKV